MQLTSLDLICYIYTTWITHLSVVICTWPILFNIILDSSIIKSCFFKAIFIRFYFFFKLYIYLSTVGKLRLLCQFVCVGSFRYLAFHSVFMLGTSGSDQGPGQLLCHLLSWNLYTKYRSSHTKRTIVCFNLILLLWGRFSTCTQINVIHFHADSSLQAQCDLWLLCIMYFCLVFVNTYA